MGFLQLLFLHARCRRLSYTAYEPDEETEQ